MRCPTTSKYRRPRPDLENFAPETKLQSASKHIPRLIVLAVDMQRSNPVVADLGSPLSEHEPVAQPAKLPSR